MKTGQKKQTPETKKIEAKLRKEFPGTTAYRYNSASIRIRIVDQRFAGKSRSEREAKVMPLIEELPEETQADIIFLLLLAPGESEESLMNFEFEKPTVSKL